MTDVNVNNTAEAMYVRALKWDFNGTYFICRGIPESIKEKLKDIFNSWGIGHDGDRRDCKGNMMNVYVSERQWRRVKFTIERPTITAEIK